MNSLKNPRLWAVAILWAICLYYLQAGCTFTVETVPQ